MEGWNECMSAFYASYAAVTEYAKKNLTPEQFDKLLEMVQGSCVFLFVNREKKDVKFSVNCNDMFYWGCADCEEMYAEDIDKIYDIWKKDGYYGVLAWASLRRGEECDNLLECGPGEGYDADIEIYKRVREELKDTVHETEKNRLAREKWEREKAEEAAKEEQLTEKTGLLNRLLRVFKKRS